MYGLFRLLFSRSYWRTLFHPETWRRTSVSLRRAHKDKRARKQLWQVLRLLIAPVVCLVYAVWVFSNPIAPIFVGLIFAFLFFRGWLRRRNAPIADPPSIYPPNMHVPQPKPLPDMTPELRKEFAELALFCAVLVDRAGSESFLKNKVLPEGFEVVTRQRHMEILREYGLYARLGEDELDLMLLPDGHWPAGMIDHVAMQLEPLRLLRWVLQVDGFLPTVGATMQADYRLASSVVKQPQMLFEGMKTASISGIRTAIEAANHYFFRCWAEGLRRGIYTGENDEDEDAASAREYAEKMHGKEGEDFLLGTTIVSKAEDSDVRLGATLALRRWRILSWVRGRMYAEAEPLDKLTQIG